MPAAVYDVRTLEDSDRYLRITGAERAEAFKDRHGIGIPQKCVAPLYAQ